ncbi:MAG: hypothetical protein M3Z75_19335 [Actinomycetota bacterium]|nr:hypothetical protein [Actinomycetota bacterium]
MAGCQSAGASWQRRDGTQVRLLWAVCDAQEINLLSATYAATRTRIPASWPSMSTLGPNVDLVRADASGPVWRFWLQGNLSMALVSICPHQAAGPCAGLTAPAARYLAARLPGQPIVTKVTSILPPTSGLLGAFALFLLIIVGGGRMRKRASLEKFHMVPGSRKLRSVDQEAEKLRKVSRQRWWARLFVIAGAALLAAGLGGVVRRLQTQAVGDVVIGVLLGAAGVAMLRRYRHPMLARERYHQREKIPASDQTDGRPLALRGLLPVIRGLLSAGFTLFLGLLSVLIPMVVLAGWVLAGLSSAEQDLSSILVVLVIVAVMAGYFIDRAAQRLRARHLQAAMRRDPDHGMLYLRNFGDDDQKIPTSRFNRRGIWQRSTWWLNPISNARFEEVLTRALAHSGPVVAVARSGKMRPLFSAVAPTLGAAKTTLPDSTWFDRVTEQAIMAHAVVVSATPAQISREGRGKGFNEELRMLAERAEHGHIILVFGTGKKEELHRRFGAFINAVRSYPLFSDLASGWISDGALVLVHVPADGWGSWIGWGAERRTAWTYTAAIDAAMTYSKQAWARTPAKLIPPPPEEPPAGQLQTHGSLASPGLAGPQLAGMPLTETVASALHAADAEAHRRGRPVDTKTLLVALMDADPAGEWHRIWLNSRSREAIERAGYQDPQEPTCRRDNVALTGACDLAFQRAWQLSQDYRETPLQLGFLVLGLIDNTLNAASRALNIVDQDQQAHMAELIQEDLIRTSLPGLRLGSSRLNRQPGRHQAHRGNPRFI